MFGSMVVVVYIVSVVTVPYTPFYFFDYVILFVPTITSVDHSLLFTDNFFLGYKFDNLFLVINASSFGDGNGGGSGSVDGNAFKNNLFTI